MHDDPNYTPLIFMLLAAAVFGAIAAWVLLRRHRVEGSARRMQLEHGFGGMTFERVIACLAGLAGIISAAIAALQFFEGRP